MGKSRRLKREKLPKIQGQKSGSMSPQWLDIDLYTESGNQPQTLTLRIKRDNLFLYGYKMPNGQWLEFNPDDGGTTHLIPGSDFLGFTGSYADLERVGQRPITGMEVSRSRFERAVDELAVANDACVRARHLALLIFVVCEASRSEEMTLRIADVMDPPGNTASMVVEEWMVESIRARGIRS